MSAKAKTGTASGAASVALMDAATSFIRAYKARLRTILSEVCSAESTPSRVMVVVVLRKHGSLPMGTIAAHVGLPKSNITALIDDLEAEGVVRRRRDEADRRITNVELTAKGEEIDRVVGFELGADDYVVKPFSVRELVLRIQAVLRRASGEEQQLAVLEFGVLRVDREAHRVWVESKEVALTALEFKLLVMLHDRRNRVQTREALLQDVWAIDADITTRTVDTHVKRLREKLGGAGEYVETVRGVGYRFADAPLQA